MHILDQMPKRMGSGIGVKTLGGGTSYPKNPQNKGKMQGGFEHVTFRAAF